MLVKTYKSGVVVHPNRSLVGKFFTSLHPPSLDRTESILRQQWKLSGGLKVFPLEIDNIIIFEFKKKRDKKKTLKEGHWNVDGFILVLNECSQDISMSDIDFSVACFWVKVIGLSYFDYTEEEAEKVGKKLSDKSYIELKYDTETNDFWVKVEINLKKPLTPGFYIGKGRKRQFIQFKYENLGEFCEHCGMISHKKCEKAAKLRNLTRKFKTHVYGPWLRYDPEPVGKGLLVKSKFYQSRVDKGLEYVTTLAYSQFFVKIEVDIVYASEHEWGGKKLIRSLLVINDYDHRFRSPCYPTQVTRDVLAFEVDKISDMARLTEEDKASVVNGLVEHVMKKREAWSSSKQRWVPILVRVEKTIMVSPVDMETMLQEDKEDQLHNAIIREIMENIDKRFENFDSFLKYTIRYFIRFVGLAQYPESFVDSLVRWVKSSNYFSPSKKLHPDHNCVTVFGPDMDLFDTCCICQEDFFLGEEATFTSPCSHVFHTHCIQDWVQESNNCPLCRLQLKNV